MPRVVNVCGDAYIPISRMGRGGSGMLTCLRSTNASSAAKRTAAWRRLESPAQLQRRFKRRSSSHSGGRFCPGTKNSVHSPAGIMAAGARVSGNGKVEEWKSGEEWGKGGRGGEEWGKGEEGFF